MIYTMNYRLISRILAIIGLVCALCMTVAVTLWFFNMTSGFFGAFALASVCATLIFFIPAYVLWKKAVSLEEAAKEPPLDGDDDDVSRPDVDGPDSDLSGEAENGESGVVDGEDGVPDAAEQQRHDG